MERLMKDIILAREEVRQVLRKQICAREPVESSG